VWSCEPGTRIMYSNFCSLKSTTLIVFEDGCDDVVISLLRCIKKRLYIRCRYYDCLLLGFAAQL
jgi:hypothetical protein